MAPVVQMLLPRRRPPGPEFKDACTDACFEILSDTPAMPAELGITESDHSAVAGSPSHGLKVYMVL
jgi:hypothetical protein